jgi:hypothetical protein
MSKLGSTILAGVVGIIVGVVVGFGAGGLFGGVGGASASMVVGVRQAATIGSQKGVIDAETAGRLVSAVMEKIEKELPAGTDTPVRSLADCAGRS